MEGKGFKCSCGSSSFEFDEGSGGNICTNCGLFVESTNDSLVVLGRVLEGESDEVGRNYVRSGAREFASGAGRNIHGRLVGKTNETNVFDYHASKRTNVEKLMKQYLSMFNVPELFQRAQYLFTQAKELMDFKWGEGANIIATACVYIASRERNRNLPLVDLACTASIDYNTLARAQSRVKVALELTIPELDPVVFLDRILLHLQAVISSPNPVLSGNPKKTKWTPSNLTWLRSLEISEVRELATGISAFSSEICLSLGRAPEQVACGVVLSSLEGIGRVPAPHGTEILQELASVVGGKAVTMAERYREIGRALIDYAPTVPWIGENGRDCNKRDLARYTEDIVKFRKSKMEKIVLEKKRELLFNFRSGEEGEDEEGEARHNFEIKGGEGAKVGGKEKGKGKGKEREREVSSEEEEGDETGSTFPDPFVSHHTAAIHSMEILTFVKGGPRPTSNSMEVTTDVILPTPRNIPVDSPLKLKRPLEYMSPAPSKGRKKSRTLELAASSLLSPFNPSSSSTPSRESNPLTRRSDTPDLSLLKTGASVTQPFPPHTKEALLFRKLLLAGNDPQELSLKIANGTITEEDVASSSSVNNRLSSLLWTKTAEEITDEELFDKGELESLVRTEEEIQLLKKTDHFSAMPEMVPYVERPISKRAPRKTKPKKPKQSRSRRLGARKVEEKEVEEQEETIIYSNRRTKAKAGTLAAVAAYFAEAQVEEDGDIREGLARQMTGAELEDLGLSEEEDADEAAEE